MRWIPLGALLILLILASCAQGPKLQVDIETESLSLSSGKAPIVVRNVATNLAVLDWSIETEADWINFSHSSGKLDPGGLQEVTLSLKPNVTIGDYNDTVTVTGVDVLPVEIPVEAIVAGCANLSTQNGAPTTNLSAQMLELYDPQAAYVPGEVLIQYKNNVKGQQLQTLSTNLAKRYNYRVVRSGDVNMPDVVAIEGDVEAAANLIAKDPNIAYAQPNYYLKRMSVNDPYYDQQWYISDYGLPAAWETIDLAKQRSQAPVVVAVIDSGVQTDHEDLFENVLSGCDIFNSDSNPNSVEDDHGTHVAGIIASTSNNSKGLTGVVKDANVAILPVKVFDDTGSIATSEKAANAIRWSAGLFVPGFNSNPTPADILNLSLGRAGNDPVLNAAIADVVAAGKLVFAASGNLGKSNGIYTPSNAPDAIAVGSIDSNLERSSFSNYDSTGAKTVKLMAPGGTLVSGKPSLCQNTRNPYYIASTLPGNSYGCLSGTSMATPYVAGVAALVWAQNRNWTAQQVQDRLFNTTYKDPSWDSNEYGLGIVCADAALGLATNCGGLGTTTSPNSPTNPTNPTSPTDPTDPTEPTDPTDPTEPTEPTDSTDPTEPTDPTDSADPTEPTDPTDPTGTTEPSPTTSANQCIGDMVWNDANQDGIFDTGELGIANVSLELYKEVGTPDGIINGQDSLVETLVTDADGKYNFCNLEAHPTYYIIKMTSSTGEVGGPLEGATLTASPSVSIALSAEQARADIDFGYSLP